MKSFWVSVRALTCLALTVVSASVCFSTPAATEPHSETGEIKREVSVAVLRSWPPQFDTNAGGAPIGFAIDVMDAVAAMAGLKVSYVQMESFPDAIAALRNGRVDIIPNIGILPQRSGSIAFTEPVETFNTRIFVRSDTYDLTGLADLPGRNLAVVENNIGMFLFRDRNDIHLHRFPDVKSAFFELLAGRVDALVYPAPVITALAHKVGLADRFKAVGEPLREVKRGLGVRVDDLGLLALLNDAVARFVGTPAYHRVYAKWYGAEKPFWSAARVGWTMGGIVVSLIFGMLWWRYLVGLRMIKAAREGEERLRGAIDSMNEGFLLFDANDELIAANKKFHKMNANVQTFLDKGGSFKEIDQDGGALGGIFDSSGPGRALGLGGESDALLRRFDDGSWYLETVSRTPDGGRAVTLADVSELIAVQDALVAARHEAELANSAKSDFLAAMSHELRTPLNAILGFAEIIREQYFGEIGDKYKEYTDDILRSGEYLLSLVNDVLDLSVIEAGKRSLAMENLETVGIVMECMRSIEDKARTNGIALMADIPDGLPSVYGDRQALKQILLNLFSNAVKFTPAGGRIQIAVSSADAGVTIAIDDTGVGIAEENIPTLTEPFSQIKGTPYLSDKGWGLGLAITKALVDLHRGSMEITSEIGKGTRVAVFFPASPFLAQTQAVTGGVTSRESTPSTGPRRQARP